MIFDNQGEGVAPSESRLHAVLPAALCAAVFACALLLAIPSYAQESPAETRTIGGENAALAVDDEAGTVTILIKGRPVVLIDETGLHVRESVSFGGTITDYGQSGFDSHAAGAGQHEE